VKDGEIIPYSKTRQNQIDSVESGRSLSDSSGAIITFEPGHEYGPESIDLDSWYDSLSPGRYQLTARKRFVRDGDWVVSNPVYFEVIPRPAASPIPAGLSFELAPEGAAAKKNGIYQVAPEVAVIVQVVNNSNQTFNFNVIDRVYGNRPQLFRDGKLIPYRDEMKQRLDAKETNPLLVEIVNDIILEPTQTWPTAIILKDWYGQLPPGSYKLINRCRFEIDGPWSAESAPLLFEIPASKRP
jgi:hypothetical protein